MRILSIIFFAKVLTGCASLGTLHIASAVSLPDEESVMLSLRVEENICDDTAAYVTRARLGNRAIVVDDITYYCF